MRVHRWFFTLLASASMMASTSLGWAASDADKATARELGQRGAEALAAKDYPRALDLFTRADQLYKAPTLSLGLARSLAGLGRLVAAREVYNRTVLAGPGPSPTPALKKAVDDARAEMAAIERRIGHVILRVEGGQPSTVTLDGEAVNLAVVGVDRPIDPGKHEAVANGAGMITARAKFEI